MRTYNADQKVEDAALAVVIGGQIFVGREPSLALMKEIADSVPDRGDEDQEQSAEGLKNSIEGIFPQLEALLREAEGRIGEDGNVAEVTKITQRKPKRDFVEKHLSMKRAGEIIETLMGGEDAGNPA